MHWVGYAKKKINQSDSEPLHNRVVASILYHIHSSSQFIYEFISCTLTHTLSISTGLSELTIDLPTLNGFKAWWLEHLQRSWVRFLLRSNWFFPGKYLQLFKLQLKLQGPYITSTCIIVISLVFVMFGFDLNIDFPFICLKRRSLICFLKQRSACNPTPKRRKGRNIRTLFLIHRQRLSYLC